MHPKLLILQADAEASAALARELIGFQCLPLALAQAAEALASACPDLVLLDVAGQAPDESRLWLRRLKAWRSSGNAATTAEAAWRAPNILVYCTEAQADGLADYLEAGADDYAVRPSSAAELRARLHSLHAGRVRLEPERRAVRWSPAPHQHGPGLAPDQVPGRTPGKLLLVDDSVDSVQTLVEFLRPEHKTMVATDGLTALELAEREQPDLIVLDVVMPGLDGHEVCRRLKANALTRDIPVIFITGQQEVEDEMAGFELGAVDYITKPFSLPVVRRRIRTHVELKRHQDQLHKQSLIDGLTGIPNRRSLERFLAQAGRQAMRQPLPIAMLLCDIDHFKAYNDGYGHPLGDECLRRVAQTLKRVSQRTTDLVARYGGEEFVCILPGTDLKGAQRIAEQLRAAVEALDCPHSAAPCGRVTISIGYACRQAADEADIQALVADADQALYRAKLAGRNRVSD